MSDAASFRVVRCPVCGVLRYAHILCEFGHDPAEAERIAKAHHDAMQPVVFLLEAAMEIDALVAEVESRE